MLDFDDGHMVMIMKAVIVNEAYKQAIGYHGGDVTCSRYLPVHYYRKKRHHYLLLYRENSSSL